MNVASWLAVALLLAIPCRAALPSFRVEGAKPEGWRRVFESVGIPESVGILPGAGESSIVVLGPDSKTDAAALASDHIVILEGFGDASRSVGVNAAERKLTVRHVVDTHAPQMPIIWEHPLEILAATLPPDFQLIAAEKWTGAPLMAGKKTARGALLWIASDPGPTAVERYPYILQALLDLGLELPARATRIWAFFDSSYRIRADVNYLAKRWRSSGIGVLHVAAWHNMEPDPQRDQYLTNLIAACHRNAILVYVWFELPHVSEAFWDQHPEWREKTAAGQDAQLDWRKLMNLANPDCHRAVAESMAGVLERFDWDGVNLAELYFESLEGASNSARFTPMNADVRSEFQEIAGFDPMELFDAASPRSHDKKALRTFLDFRAVLASRLQSDWLKEARACRKSKPFLDIVLTHIDDRFDPAIRDELGADVARTLPLLQAQKSTLLVEDPANLWDLGAQRYARLAEKYRTLTPTLRDVAVDINVVERYQDVYPTKKQTGTELFELVHEAARSFGAVAIYFEQSVERQDWPLLASAAATAHLSESAGSLAVESPATSRIRWTGPANLDGHPWPVMDADGLLTPAGEHQVSHASSAPAVVLSDFNGDIRSALTSDHSTELGYTSKSRAIAVLSSPIASIELDGQPFAMQSSGAVMLPAGQHVVRFSK